MTKTTYGVHSKFDIEQHKKNFVDYLEVVILEDGTIEYAVPSHQQKLLRLTANMKGMSEREVSDLCPASMYCDFDKWLSQECKAIPVWNGFYMGNPNEAQFETLKTLKLERLYQGALLPSRF